MAQQESSSTFASFRVSPALEAMLTFAGWRGGFTEADRDAMAEGLSTIRTAMVQPVGATASAKARSRECVTDAEFDGAVMRVLAAAMCLWLSGRLAEVRCDG